MRADGGELSAYRGDFGEAWLEVVAAGHRFLHGKATTLDFERADVEITFRGELAGVEGPAVKAQVKTTSKLTRDEKSGDLTFDLDVETYNYLRKSNHGVARVLVVIQLDDPNDWIDVQSSSTHLKGRGGWVSLRGESKTENTATVRVTIPADNTLDRDGIERMLVEAGKRRSTPVPSLVDATE